MSISMSEIWDESAALIRRESHLLVPVALATVGMGALILELIVPDAPTELTMAVFLGFVSNLMLSLLGNLAMTALILMPGTSVGEALSLAFSRLPKILIIGLLLSLAGAAMMLPVLIILKISGVTLSPNMKPEQLPAAAIFAALVFGTGLLYVSARLLTLNGMVIGRNPSALEAINASYASTRGVVAKIVGVLLLFFVVTLVVGTVATLLSGILFGTLGQVIGVPLLGTTLTALATSMVTALLSIVSTVFAAQLYRRLSVE